MAQKIRFLITFHKSLHFNYLTSFIYHYYKLQTIQDFNLNLKSNMNVLLDMLSQDAAIDSNSH